MKQQQENKAIQNLTPGDLYVLTDNCAYIPGVLCQRHRISARDCYFIGVRPPFRGNVIASSEDIKKRNSQWHIYNMHMEEIFRWSCTDLHPMTIEEHKSRNKDFYAEYNKPKKNKKDDNSH